MCGDRVSFCRIYFSLQAEFSPTRASRFSSQFQREARLPGKGRAFPAGTVLAKRGQPFRVCLSDPRGLRLLRQLGAFSVCRWNTNHEHRSFNISEPRINERIRVPEVRLVGPAGEQVGVVRIEDALRLAAESDLDLVEVAPQAKPPVCKLMDFGKYKYEAAVKAREARKNQTNTVLKEIRFRLKNSLFPRSAGAFLSLAVQCWGSWSLRHLAYMRGTRYMVRARGKLSILPRQRCSSR